MRTDDWQYINHFKPSEFTAPEKMESRLVRALDRVRERAGVPIHVTSSYRDGDDGAHGSGWAVDISDNMEGNDIGSRWRFLVVNAAYRAGFRRIGVYDRHVHIDLDTSRDQDVLWVGVSQ